MSNCPVVKIMYVYIEAKYVCCSVILMLRSNALTFALHGAFHYSKGEAESKCKLKTDC